MYGDRNRKYDLLSNTHLKDIDWNEIEVRSPENFFIPRDYNLQEEFHKGFSIESLFVNNSTGITTERDEVCIQFSDNEIKEVVNALKTLTKNLSEMNTLQKKMEEIGRSLLPKMTFLRTKENLKDYNIAHLIFEKPITQVIAKALWHTRDMKPVQTLLKRM